MADQSGNDYSGNANRSESRNDGKYYEAGETAARAFGQMFELAAELGNAFRGAEKRDSPTGRSYTQADRATAGESARTYTATDAEWQEVGEQLRQFREAAGYSLAGFAKVLNQTGNEQILQAVEQGLAEFPREWLEQVAPLMGRQVDGCEPAEFFRECGKHAAGTAAESSSAAVTNEKSARQQQLLSIFSDNSELEKLTDEQFASLFDAMQVSYQSSLNLLRKR